MKSTSASPAWGKQSSTPVVTTTTNIRSLHPFMASPKPTLLSPAKVDSYTQQLLQEKAEAGADPDSSLASYINSILRSTDVHIPLEHLPEYESLRELIQEQCWVDSTTAGQILAHIHTAVWTQQLPLVEEMVSTTGTGTTNANTTTTRTKTTTKTTSTTTSQIVVSPHAADTLILNDLWGAIDNSPPTPGDAANTPTNTGATTTTVPTTTTTTTTLLYAQNTIVGNTGYARNETASPTLEYTEMEPYVSTTTTLHAPEMDAYQIEQAFESSVEILLSMNPDIAEDAARQALQLVQGDVNWGQYLVDVALTAPPVCRHLLNDGCYRRDCQFSHDIDGHTCVFWLRGRCGKGSSCPFRHGFDEKALRDVLPASVEVTPEPEAVLPSLSTSPTVNDPPLPKTMPTTTTTTATSTANYFSSKMGSIWGDRTSSTSFAQIASQGGPQSSAFPALSATGSGGRNTSEGRRSTTSSLLNNTRRVDIPQDLWHAHENRDSAVFYIADPLERYESVTATVRRKNVIDLHFQSTKTFPIVLETILPQKLTQHQDVWIVTGTGHHVGNRTHQKSGGLLENAVMEWLEISGYKFLRGRDRNGLGGALLVQR